MLMFSKPYLPGANITVKGKVNKGTITDRNGKFSIRMDANADVIEVSFVGYERVKVKLGTISQNLTISLVPSTEDLNEVEVPANPVTGAPEKPATSGNLARPTSFHGAGHDQTWIRWGLNAKYEVSDALKFSASYFGGRNDQASNSLTGPDSSSFE